MSYRLLEHEIAVELYANPSRPSHLPLDQVEAAVTEAIFSAYDGASNGNKTRGGIKRASEMYIPVSANILSL